MRIIFAGTPDFAAAHLQSLIASHDHEVVAVYTQPDRKAGRGKQLTPSPVKTLALEHGIPVEQPLNFKDAADIEHLSSYNADIMVVVAYGLLLPQAVLDTPKRGCINVHASLLPRWRGAAPIQRAIEAGDTESGITIMQMELGLDTGPMLAKASINIGKRMTGGELHDAFIPMGQKLLIETLDQITADTVSVEIQDDSLANYAHKLSKDDARIDWSDNAEKIDAKIRGMHPFPVAWTMANNNVIRVHQAEVISAIAGQAGEIVQADKSGIVVACGTGAIRLITLQIPGKRAMSVSDLINGRPDLFKVGDQFE